MFQFTNKAYRDDDCVAARRSLDSDHGDPITLLNAFREWLKIKVQDRDNSKRWCRKRGLEEQRFYEMIKLRKQFEELLDEAGLFDKKNDDAGLTSAERMARHGQLKHLKHMKKNAKKQDRKRKTLRVGDTEELDDIDDNEVDMKDIDFRLKNDSSRVRQLLESSVAVSYTDVTMLKLIMASGLYPQLAIADEFNNYKGGSDQLFHTRVKPFNVLHPNCFFSAHPEVLQVDGLDIVNMKGFTTKHPASSKHQLLVYLSLLETTKPYLTSSLRMPALPTLLLFSHSMDTNSSMDRVVCDSWIEIKFAQQDDAVHQMIKAVELRQYWDQLLDMKLSDSADQQVENIRDIEKKLSRGLIEFVHNDTVYSVRRLLPADIKELYVGQTSYAALELENPLSDFPPVSHPVKGGVRLTKNLTYDCLSQDNPCLDADLWTCSQCEKEMYCSTLQKVQHVITCNRIKQEEEMVETEKFVKVEQQEKNPLARSWNCGVCGENFNFTSGQIMRHKKVCVKKD